MYKVLIVDDEPIIRLGLRKMIKWEEEGFVVVKDAKNGKEAIEFIENENVDLIITDISMPIMDGIELVRLVRKYNKNIKIVFLTGYKEFDYAREGIKLGVEDYLLKPIDPKNLKNVLLKIRELLNENMKLKNILENIESKQILDVIQGKEKNVSILKKYIDKKYLTICKIDIENFDSLAERWIKENIYYEKINCLKNSIDKNLKSKSIFLEGEIGNYYLLVESNDIENNMESYMKDIESKCKDIKFNSIIGKTVDIDNITKGYSSLKNKSILTKKKLEIKYSNILDKYNEKDIIKLVIDGNESVFTVIDEIYNNIEKNNLDINSVALSLQNIIEKIVERMKGEYGYINKLVEIENYEYFYKREYTDIESLISEFKETIHSIIYIFGKLNVEFRDNIIRQACKFVIENIDSDISLTIVSENLNLSRNYLCTLFKNETGENFLTFVTRAKMERAKFLLRNSNMKVYEVCDFLGYNDTTYFTRIFKKYVNMTPYEYKRVGD